jgi:hypothetical protein
MEQVTFLEGGVQDFDWSRDGGALVLSRSISISDIVRVTGFR